MADPVQELRTFYEGLPPARRRTLWAALGLSLATIAGVGTWASQPHYVTLTTPTDAEERTEITDALSRQGVGWRLADDHNTIEVLDSEQARARSAAATDHGILGLEGLEQIDPWSTPFVELLQKQRMLQGEIVRSVNRMDGVARSACILNLPSSSEFIGRSTAATAAVTLSPEPGVVLSRETGETVAVFVAHAVAGMTDKDVTVIDTSTGRTLWGGSAPDAATIGTSGEEARHEAALTDKVNRVLTSVLGSPSSFAVAVKVELTTASTQSTVNSVDPDSAAPTTEHTETEQGGQTTNGVPGASSNLPERATTASSGSHSTESAETTYQYTRTQTQTVQPAGELKHLSASVVISKAALATLVGDGKSGDEAAQKARLETLVKAALGADEKRGDTVVVEVTPFAEPALSDAEDPAIVAAAWQTWVPYGLAAFVTLALLLFGVRPLVKAAAGPTAVAAGKRGKGDDAVPDGETAPAAAHAGEGAEVIDIGERLRRHVENYKHISSEDISALVGDEADSSAEVLRRWMQK